MTTEVTKIKQFFLQKRQLEYQSPPKDEANRMNVQQMLGPTEGPCAATARSQVMQPLTLQTKPKQHSQAAPPDKQERSRGDGT